MRAQRADSHVLPPYSLVYCVNLYMFSERTVQMILLLMTLLTVFPLYAYWALLSAFSERDFCANFAGTFRLVSGSFHT